MFIYILHHVVMKGKTYYLSTWLLEPNSRLELTSEFLNRKINSTKAKLKRVNGCEGRVK